MKILIVPSAYYPSLGGVEEIARNLNHELTERGLEVAIAVNRHPMSLSRRETVYGANVNRFDFFYPSRSVKDIFKIYRCVNGLLGLVSFMRRWRPDIVHIVCPSACAYYIWACQRLFKYKVMVTFQGELFMDATRIYERSQLMRAGLRTLLTVTSSITACSQYVLTDAETKYALTQKLKKIVFNGIDLSEHEVSEKSTIHVRKYVLGVGRLVENKGFQVLIKAFAELASLHPNTDLIIVGDGPYGDQLKKLTEALLLADRIIFAGRKNRFEISEYFRNCEFFVMPSPVEPFGIVCLEAMRAGKAVIASNSGGPPEFIRPGEEGLLVESNCVSELKTGLDALLSDEFRCQTMGKKGFDTVQKFSWQLITQQYFELYELLMKQ